MHNSVLESLESGFWSPSGFTMKQQIKKKHSDSFIMAKQHHLGVVFFVFVFFIFPIFFFWP